MSIKVKVTQPETINLALTGGLHNNLAGLQGGSQAERFHLTEAERDLIHQNTGDIATISGLLSDDALTDIVFQTGDQEISGLKSFEDTVSINADLNQSGNFNLIGNINQTGDNAIVGDVSIDGAIATVDSIQFDTTAAITVGQGQLAWNAEDVTLDLGLDGVTLQLGQEQMVRVKADGNILNGMVVYASATTGGSDNIEVSRFSAAAGGVDEIYFLGIATEEILDNAIGFVTTFGRVREVDGRAYGTSNGIKDPADISTWAFGTVLYVSPNVAGCLTSIRPTAPDRRMAIAMVLKAPNQQNITIMVRAEHGYHIDELHDVRQAINLQNNDVLSWDATSGVWGNRNLNDTYYTEDEVDQLFLQNIGSIATAVYITGDQLISGIKTFDSYINLKTDISDIALSGYAEGGIKKLFIGADSIVTEGNILGSNKTVVLGGENNIGSGDYNFIGGGFINRISPDASYSFVGGGINNFIESGNAHSIVAGYYNSIQGASSVGGNNILGGKSINIQNSSVSTVCAGEYNQIIDSEFSTVLGGTQSIISGHTGATILGDGQNREKYSQGNYSLTLDFASGIHVPTGVLYLSERPTVNGTGVLLEGEGGVWQENGSNIYYNDGNVGIGTTTPTKPLDVIGDIRSSAGIIGSRVEIASDIRHSGDEDTKLAFETDTIKLNTAGLTRLSINSSGNIGIGTTTPTEKLTVAGTVAIKDTTETKTLTLSCDALGDSAINTSGKLSLQSSLTLISNGIGTTNGSGGGRFGYNDGTSWGPYIGFINSEIIYTKSVSKVGIGTIAPTAKLSIVDTTLAGSGSLSGSALDITQTWNTTGTPTAIKLDVTDTASDASSLLMDLQVGGSNKFSIRKDGECTLGENGAGFRVWNARFGAHTSYPTIFNGSSQVIAQFHSTEVRFGYQIGFYPPNYATPSSNDLILARDTTDTLAQRRSTNPQTFRLYNTYTDASNYERGFLRWNSDVLEIGTEAGGTGTVRTLRLVNGSYYTSTSISRYSISFTHSWGQSLTLDTNFVACSHNKWRMSSTSGSESFFTPNNRGTLLRSSYGNYTESADLNLGIRGTSNGSAYHQCLIKYNATLSSYYFGTESSVGEERPLTLGTNGSISISIDNSQNVGIGTTSPASKLTVTGGDSEITDIGSGVILKSPDGTRYRITVANGGTLTVAAV